MKKVGLVWIAAWLSLITATFGAPGDEHWDIRFGWPGTTNTIWAITPHNGQLFISGSDGSGTTNASISKWDGVNWTNFSTFKGATIYDIKFVGESMYVGGYFTNVDGLPYKALVRYDGTNWIDMGFTGGTVVAMALDGNDLYVGGVFTNTAVGATNIARWDGTNWYALGDGVGKSGDVVRALAVTNGLVYVGGNFTNCGGVAVSNIAVWNGLSWAGLGSGVNSYVMSLALNGSDLYASGLFSSAGGVTVNDIARWDGASWNALGSTTFSGGSPNKITVLHNLLYVGGTFTNVAGVSAPRIASWNGASWSAVGAGLSSTCIGLAADNSKVYAGGNFLLAGSLLAPGIAAWDGNSWSSIGNPAVSQGSSSVVRCFAKSGNTLYAGGSSFVAIGQAVANRIASFDGANWQALGAGLNSNVTSIAVTPSRVFAAGDFTGSTGVFAYHLAQWDGTNWAQVGYSTNGGFGSISKLIARGNDLYVAGYFTINAADGTCTWLTRWDGTNFWNVPLSFPPYTDSAFYLDGVGYTACEMQGSNIWLSGHFSIGEQDGSFVNYTNCDNCMWFDGTTTWVMGTGLNTNATSIAAVGTNVYFAGPFTTAGGVAVSKIARWDGSRWWPVGSGVVGNGIINALAAAGTNLYAGGSFTNMGGVSVNRVAKWDGTSWSALGSGISYPGASSATVSTLFGSSSDLYAGGTFRASGGKAAYYIAHWNDTRNFDVPQTIVLRKMLGAPGFGFKFDITTTEISSYVIEGSSDFSTWTPLETNTASFYEFWDNDTSRAQRFYRVRGQ